jgi:acyl carrier protein
MDQDPRLDTASVKEAIKTYLLTNFLPGAHPDTLTDSTPLITSGLLDSITTIQLVAFLEAHYGVTFQAHEMSTKNLNTLADIARFLQARRPQP